MCPIPDAEKARLEEVKSAARALFAPERGGHKHAWLQRPLPSLLLEYATDVRYFHPLRSSFNRSRNGHCRGVEEMFFGVLSTLSDTRVAESCTVAAARSWDTGASRALAASDMVESLREHIELHPDGTPRAFIAATVAAAGVKMAQAGAAALPVVPVVPVHAAAGVSIFPLLSIHTCSPCKLPSDCYC
jgi:hypothetical protein